MSDRLLFRLLAACAIVGGLLRIGSAFLIWDSSDFRFEILADLIDMFLLFGLMGYYFVHRQALGFLGFVGFFIAESGIALILGPDTVAFAIDTYQSGAAIIGVGLGVLGARIVMQPHSDKEIGICWMLSLGTALAGNAVGEPAFGFFIGGILFALGFVFAGAATLRAAARLA